jgi:hypothetical protein
MKQIEDTPTHQAIAYGSGKAVGAAITKFAPEANEDLGKAWDNYMERGKGLDMMPEESTLMFFGEATMIVTLYTGDDYGLLQDLSVLLMIFGAEFDADNEMVSIEPVPMSVLRFFEMGYDSGVMIMERELEL